VEHSESRVSEGSNNNQGTQYYSTLSSLSPIAMARVSICTFAFLFQSLLQCATFKLFLYQTNDPIVLPSKFPFVQTILLYYYYSYYDDDDDDDDDDDVVVVVVVKTAQQT